MSNAEKFDLLTRAIGNLAEAISKTERTRCVDIIQKAELVENGPIPDEVWNELNGNRELTEKFLRTSLLFAKERLINEILAEKQDVDLPMASEEILIPEPAPEAEEIKS